ncbi:MAG TPA: glucose-6-phosphate dehydrogenase assembly protein OpcA [Thermoanaerobaculia bacterium]|jgi:glucose-6-phosphate dehydrogenase assembly protein OpcA
MNDDNLRVDYSSIEKSLADLWRNEPREGEKAVTRAALWNVVAHTWEADHHALATETLSRASESVPQRAIIIHSTPEGESGMSSWISANCHLLGKEKQVCSEEIKIVAGGDRIHHVPPLVSALLIPDMPVAVWWLGDLPSEHEDYVEALLQPADRLIVDSSHFDQPSDLALVARIAEQTTTAPADLNWVRLEEWRAALASLFDPPRMRERMRAIRSVRIAGAGGSFGRTAEALLFAAWISAQLGHHVDADGSVEHGEIVYDLTQEESPRGMQSVELRFTDDSVATISRDRDRGVLITSVDGTHHTFECVTRVLAHGRDDLIVRQLKRPEADRVYVKALPIATRLARRA